MTSPSQPDADRFADSRIAAQLTRGFRWLRFEPGLEQEFRDNYLSANRAQLRLNLALAVVLVGAFSILDRMLLDGSTQGMPDLLRFGVMVPLMLLLIAVSYSGAYLRWYPRLVKAVMPITAACVVAIEAQAARDGVDLVFSTLVITTFYGYFLVGMRFYAAFCTNLSLLVSYLAAAFWLQPALPFEQILYGFSVLALAQLVGAVACYTLETANRTRYLEARLLGEMAARDGLTALYNRRTFDERLEQLWQQGIREQTSLAVLLVDIDHFKAFNDRYGHQAGDQALRAVAAVLARHARRPLDFTARYGGEEFALVQYGIDCPAATQVAEQLREQVQGLGIRHPQSAGGMLTISIGVACIQPVTERTHHGLVQLADEALYAAKGGGRNQMVLKADEYEELVTGDFRRERETPSL